MNALPLTDPAEERASPLPPPDGPGRRLRDARQARGLELARVAEQLHLKPTLIAALEQDDYDALPGPVFIIGYLRNYARLLGLDPEPLLAAYRRGTPQAEPPPSQPRPVAGPPSKGGQRIARAVTLVLILGLLALSYAWWHEHRPSLYPGVASDETVSGELDLTGSEPPPPEPPSRDTEPAQAAGVAEALPSPPVWTSPPPARLASEGLPSAPLAAVAAEVAPSPPPAETLAMVPPEPAPMTAPPAPSPGEVVMEFTGPCWVDIRDRERRFKLFGEMKDGDRHVLAGTPPYSVIIGNAAAVRISVGGKPFPLEGIARGNVARFSLDPERIP